MNDYDDELDINISLDDLGLVGIVEKIYALKNRIPQGVNDFQVDGYYEEQFFIEFEENGYDNDFFNNRVESLPLFCDRGRLARSTRIKMDEKGMKGKISTQKAFLKANTDCKETTPHAMADLLAETDTLLGEVAQTLEALPERIARLVVAPLMQKINELQVQLEENENRRAALEQGNQENLGKAIERMSSGETGRTPSLQEEGEKKLTKKEREALKEQQEKEEEQEAKRQRKATQAERMAEVKANSRQIALDILHDERVVDRLLEGLPGIKEKTQLWEYVERVLCIEARVAFDTAYTVKLCEVYAANVGYSTTGNTVRTQLGEYLRKGQEEGKYD